MCNVVKIQILIMGPGLTDKGKLNLYVALD